jgi:hypothetical protein
MIAPWQTQSRYFALLNLRKCNGSFTSASRILISILDCRTLGAKRCWNEKFRALKMSNAIIRPTVIFGFEDILINNIAYLLRKMPLFVILGSGQYRLQPVYVDDVAQIAIKCGRREC